MPKHDPRYDDPPDDPRDLTSRTDTRRQRKESEAQLFTLAEKLVSLSDRVRAKIELSEEILEAIALTRKIRSAPARTRALRSLRILLRTSGPARIQNELDEVLDPSRGGTMPRAVEHWRERLLGGGDAELALFMESYPGADRKRLRQLLQNARHGQESALDKARRRLSDAIEACLKKRGR